MLYKGLRVLLLMLLIPTLSACEELESLGFSFLDPVGSGTSGCLSQHDSRDHCYQHDENTSRPSKELNWFLKEVKKQ